jgi:GH15 family glucan-1,4-alpha-glucosidase
MPRDLPLGNGTVLVNFDENYTLRDIYFPHVGREDHTIGHISRFGVWVDGDFAWVGPEWIVKRTYLPETLVTDVVLRHERLGLELTMHDAVEFHLWVFLREIQVRDLIGRPRQVKLYFNHDFHIKETDVGDTAFYDPLTQAVIHYKDDRWFLINLCDPEKCGVDQWATGQKECNGLEGTWRDAEDGQLSGNPISQGSVDSTIGIEFNLPASSTKIAHYWICFGTAYEKVVKLNSIVRQKTPEKLIARTEHYWQLWVNKEGRHFGDLPPEIIDLYKRSLLIMRTQIDDGGAIIAANDSDIRQFSRDTYSYMWPRDGALCANALSLAGYSSVCQHFFMFCLDVIREEGFLLHKYNPDKTLASSWHPWLKDGHFSLPIQEDETALVLWSLWQHYAHFKDVEFIKPLFRRLITNAADFLARYRDDETGLPKPSYDLWEERWGVHLFTVASVIGGLTAAANFSNLFGETEEGERYATTAQEVKEAMLKYMWSEKDGRFCRRATRLEPNHSAGSASTNTDTSDRQAYELDMTVDASQYAIFAFGALPANDRKVQATMKAIKDYLWVKAPSGGVARYTNDYYHQVSKDISNVPGNPWFICTMWLAQYQIASATTLDELSDTVDILRWVTEHALPSGVLAEQINPYTNAPISVSPLTWSHATFVTCVLEYLEKRTKLLGRAEIDGLLA